MEENKSVDIAVKPGDIWRFYGDVDKHYIIGVVTNFQMKWYFI